MLSLVLLRYCMLTRAWDYFTTLIIGIEGRGRVEREDGEDDYCGYGYEL